ncbi:uncharacterized protein EAF01_007823 [Botrytis porri]|uniref:uncharacterized protein n=1 Tax=Botrytis porri TaxID=87229 RepID=UPI00190080A1|nr:uncharacterized protein EAF01_007823 [Botrytis porri]KAF7900521.1 hypothetical protein EAF01_007823 [Botrytis porri]
MQPSLSKVPRPAFAHCSDTTQGAIQALNFFAHHNNFTKLPEGINCIAKTSMKMENEQITAGEWAMMSVLFFIFVAIIRNFDFKMRYLSDSRPTVEVKKEERIPFLAQEEKSG